MKNVRSGLFCPCLRCSRWSSCLSGPAQVARPSCAISNAKTHKDYSSLQSAVDAAKAGNTLEVKGELRRQHVG